MDGHLAFVEPSRELHQLLQMLISKNLLVVAKANELAWHPQRKREVTYSKIIIGKRTCFFGSTNICNSKIDIHGSLGNTI
jgi:hypothetical protein